MKKLSYGITSEGFTRLAQDSGSNLVDLAYEFGYSSPNSAPAQDSRLMKLIESNSSKEIGGSIPLMKAWLEGHSDANSESFEEEFKDDEVMNQLPSWGQRFRSKDSKKDLADKLAKKPSKGVLNKAYKAIQSFVEDNGYTLIESSVSAPGASYGSYGDLLSSGGEFELETDDARVMVNGIINEDFVEVYLTNEDGSSIAEAVVDL